MTKSKRRKKREKKVLIKMRPGQHEKKNHVEKASPSSQERSAGLPTTGILLLASDQILENSENMG